MGDMEEERLLFIRLAKMAQERVEKITVLRERLCDAGHKTEFEAGKLDEAKWWLKKMAEAAAEPNPSDEVAPG